MPGQHNFEYLPLLRTYKGRARLRGGGNPSPQTVANRNTRQIHSATLDAAAQAFSADWRQRKAQRQAADPKLPEVPAGVPILLEVDPSLDLDALRQYFAFECESGVTPAFGQVFEGLVLPRNPGKSGPVRLDFVVQRWIDSNFGQTTRQVIPFQYFGITFHESGSFCFCYAQPSTSRGFDCVSCRVCA